MKRLLDDDQLMDLHRYNVEMFFFGSVIKPNYQEVFELYAKNAMKRKPAITWVSVGKNFAGYVYVFDKISNLQKFLKENPTIINHINIYNNDVIIKN